MNRQICVFLKIHSKKRDLKNSQVCCTWKESQWFQAYVTEVSDWRQNAVTEMLLNFKTCDYSDTPLHYHSELFVLCVCHPLLLFM